MALGLGGRPSVMVTLLVAMFALIGSTFPFVARRLDLLIWPVLLFLGRLPSVSYSGDMHEFLLPRPFRNGPRVVGGVVFPLLLALSLPALGLSFLSQDWFESGGLFGHVFKHRPPSEDDVRYMREILGATFLPANWPTGGLPAALWVQLRPLLLLDALRTALLLIGMVFGLSPLSRADEKPSLGSLQVAPGVAFLIIFVLFARVTFLATFAKWPVPRLWFLALLAAVAMAHWSWKAYRLNAPARSSKPRG